jgi:hypothetical protein
LEQSPPKGNYGVCSVDRNLSEDRKVLAAMCESSNMSGGRVSEEDEG